MDDEEISPYKLPCAAGDGYISEVLELLDAGVPVDYTYGMYGTALHEAVVFGHTEIATLLLDRGADVNKVVYEGLTPLHYAVLRQSRNLELVTLLLDRGANVNAKNEDYCTPIHQAVFAERHDLVALLASRGAEFTTMEEDALEFSLSQAEERLAAAAAEVEMIRSTLALASASA